jgi:hypothetical protein
MGSKAATPYQRIWRSALFFISAIVIMGDDGFVRCVAANAVAQAGGAASKS